MDVNKLIKALDDDTNDSLMNLTSQAGKSELVRAMQGHILVQAELIGLYSRE